MQKLITSIQKWFIHDDFRRYQLYFILERIIINV